MRYRHVETGTKLQASVLSLHPRKLGIKDVCDHRQLTTDDWWLLGSFKILKSKDSSVLCCSHLTNVNTTVANFQHPYSLSFWLCFGLHQQGNVSLFLCWMHLYLSAVCCWADNNRWWFLFEESFLLMPEMSFMRMEMEIKANGNVTLKSKAVR